MKKDMKDCGCEEVSRRHGSKSLLEESRVFVGGRNHLGNLASFELDGYSVYERVSENGYSHQCSILCDVGLILGQDLRDDVMLDRAIASC